MLALRGSHLVKVTTVLQAVEALRNPDTMGVIYPAWSDKARQVAKETIPADMPELQKVGKALLFSSLPTDHPLKVNPIFTFDFNNLKSFFGAIGIHLFGKDEFTDVSRIEPAKLFDQKTNKVWHVDPCRLACLTVPTGFPVQALSQKIPGTLKDLVFTPDDPAQAETVAINPPLEDALIFKGLHFSKPKSGSGQGLVHRRNPIGDTLPPGSPGRVVGHLMM